MPPHRPFDLSWGYTYGLTGLQPMTQEVTVKRIPKVRMPHVRCTSCKGSGVIRLKERGFRDLAAVCGLCGGAGWYRKVELGPNDILFTRRRELKGIAIVKRYGPIISSRIGPRVTYKQFLRGKRP